MASSYPASLDSFTAIASDKKTSDSVGGRTHRDMHNDLGDAVEAVQAELGTAPSGSYTTVRERFEAIEGSTLPQVDAKGDLIVGTADNTYDNLTAGTNDTVLVADSAQTKGVKWAQVPTAGIADDAVTSAKIAAGTIVNADINASAAIDRTKLAQLAYAAKTSAYTATTADDILNITSGTFTLDLPAASTCAGKTLRIKNSGGSGVVTLDGNSSETVEGVATFPLGPGSYVEITSTGSAWILTNGLPDTGWRNIASWDAAGTVTGTMPTGFVPRTGAAGYITVRRVGKNVYMNVAALQLNATNPVLDSANVAGFRCRSDHDLILRVYNGSAWALTYAGTAGTSQWTITGTSGHFTFRSEWSWATTDAWPTSLPGSAA